MGLIQLRVSLCSSEGCTSLNYSIDIEDLYWVLEEIAKSDDYLYCGFAVVEVNSLGYPYEGWLRGIFDEVEVKNM